MTSLYRGAEGVTPGVRAYTRAVKPSPGGVPSASRKKGKAVSLWEKAGSVYRAPGDVFHTRDVRAKWPAIRSAMIWGQSESMKFYFRI